MTSYILGAALCVLAPQVQATEVDVIVPTSGARTGFNAAKHVYGFLGIGVINGNYSTTYTGGPNLGTTAHPQTMKLGNANFAGLIGLGGAYDFNRFQAGLELFWIGDSQKVTDTIGPAGITTNQHLAIKSNAGAWGAQVVLGYYLSHTKQPLGYILLGLTGRNLHLSATDSIAGAPSIGQSKTTTTFSPGLGFKYYFTPSWNAGLEWRAEIGKAVSASATNAHASNTLRATPTSHAFLLRVGYSFRFR